MLNKPSWAPPSWLFGPVWSVLYLIIFFSFAWVFTKYVNGKMPTYVVIPFALNLVFNFLFTPLQFGLRNNLLALFDIVLVWGTIVWMFWVIWPYAGWVVYVNIGYLVWVSFATVLQASITFLNR